MSEAEDVIFLFCFFFFQFELRRFNISLYIPAEMYSKCEMLEVVYHDKVMPNIYVHLSNIVIIFPDILYKVYVFFFYIMLPCFV